MPSKSCVSDFAYFLFIEVQIKILIDTKKIEQKSLILTKETINTKHSNLMQKKREYATLNYTIIEEYHKLITKI